MFYWNGTKRNPGFVVCDVLLNDRASEREIAPFLHKCQTLQQLRKVGKSIHFFVAVSYTHEALKQAKTAGLVPATPDNLFGKGASEGFKELAAVLKEAALGTTNPDKFNQLFMRLSHIEGAVGNMRGALFEMLVAEVVRRTEAGGQHVLLNKRCKDNEGNVAEVDAYLATEKLERMIECKGKHPNAFVDDEEIKLWLHTRIKRVRQHLDRMRAGAKLKPVFELWVSGRLTTHSIEMIKATRQANQKQYELIVRSPDEIRREVAKVGNISLAKPLNSISYRH